MPEPIISELQLEEALSRPTPADVAAMAALDGDLLILGVSGKTGPTLARLARRASDAAGVGRRVIGAARFSQGSVRRELERDGIETIPCDLLNRTAVERLPHSPNVVFMVGQKFGTAADEARTWAVNTVVPTLAAERFPGSRFVVFSTGNVYPLTLVGSGGARESDPVGPVGDYAQSALARERVFEFYARRDGTPVAMLRLNYANELRYGVLRDVGDRVFRREPVPLAMGHVNVIWQRDANSVALRACACAATPPFVLNVTGLETVSIRWLAEQFGARFGLGPVFEGAESDTALLSNAQRCAELFGPPSVSLEQMIDWVAEWVQRGGRSLGQPTHFEVRDGAF